MADGRAQGLNEGRALGLVAGREESAAKARIEDDLAEAFRALDAAGSLSEILETLLASTSRQASRVAVLLARGAELHVWRSAGLDPADLLELPLDRTGLLRDAVRTHLTTSAAASNGHEHSTPEGDDLLAVPIILGGEAVAVVYAGQGPGEKPAPSWRTSVELMTRHAARSLEAVTAFRTAALIAAPDGLSSRQDG